MLCKPLNLEGFDPMAWVNRGIRRLSRTAADRSWQNAVLYLTAGAAVATFVFTLPG